MGDFIGAWCSDCGPLELVDEDGCCSCGGYALGDGANLAHRYRAALDKISRQPCSGGHTNNEDEASCARHIAQAALDTESEW